MTREEKEMQSLKIVNLRIENAKLKYEQEKDSKLVEMWKFSNSKLCQKLEQIENQLYRTQQDLLKLRNS